MKGPDKQTTLESQDLCLLGTMPSGLLESLKIFLKKCGFVHLVI